MGNLNKIYALSFPHSVYTESFGTNETQSEGSVGGKNTTFFSFGMNFGFDLNLVEVETKIKG